MQASFFAELSAAHVLVKSGDEYRFQYKYAYYFSVAKYFQEALNDTQGNEKLRAQLQELTECIHDEDSSNILIFYIYLTKSRWVIDQIRQVACEVYKDKEKVRLTNDVEFVNKWRTKSSDVTLRGKEIDKNREERRSEMDTAQDMPESTGGTARNRS